MAENEGEFAIVGDAIVRVMAGDDPAAVLSQWAAAIGLSQDEAVVVLYWAGTVLSKRGRPAGAWSPPPACGV